MEKQKRWQLFLIVAVLVLTLYNILPTIFFYTKPLKEPIDSVRAEQVSLEIVDRVNTLGEDAKEWLSSYTHLLGLKPLSIDRVTTNPGLIQLTFRSEKEAQLFKKFLPQAGLLIPFVPSQLSLASDGLSRPGNEVLVQRNLAVELDPSQLDQIFHFTEKYGTNGQVADFYRDIINDRIAQIALTVAGPSRNAVQAKMVVDHLDDSLANDLILSLSKEIVEIDALFGKNSAITKRYFSSFSQLDGKEGESLPQKFLLEVETLAKKMGEKKNSLLAIQKTETLDPAHEQELKVLETETASLEAAAAILKKNLSQFQQGKKPLSLEQIYALLAKDRNSSSDQLIDLEGYNPFVRGLTVQWDNSDLALNFYADVESLRNQEVVGEKEAFIQNKTNQWVINEVARIARLSDESFLPSGNTYTINFDVLSGSKSYLALNLGYLAHIRSQQVMDQLLLSWVPNHTDLVRESYPVRSYEAFKNAPVEEQKLGLVIYAPSIYPEAPLKGFRNGSIYVIAKGMDALVRKHKESPNSPENQQLAQDFNQLNAILQQMGFLSYSGASFEFPKEFSKDFIFELSDYYSTLLKSTREDFTVKGSKKYAVLGFTDVEQRILTLNKIEDRIQEDLLKWKESYAGAQVELKPTDRYLVPAPTKSAFWENLKLSAKKYFRGDDRKILKWGLDLSGGKTVRIALYDHNNRQVTHPEDLNQAVNELYTRINKMGVAERTIRIENSNILLDFPGSQNLSAADLVQASAMYFHIVNEKFGVANPALASTVNQFLQNVWNEAVVTNRKDMASINEIAWNHLGGDTGGAEFLPRNDYAKLLYEQGLRLANPKEQSMNSSFNDTLSSIAILRGDDPLEWGRQSHPLLIVFHNFALEGSSLENVTPGYDSSQGNILSFGVKKTYEGSQERGGQGSPREDLFTWTSQFAQDKIVGTIKEVYSGGKGWRMAVILNGTVITSPNLSAEIKDGGLISGRFSQREVNQLAADLKAGSLSFTPKILSEENVSPELGKEERFKGMLASSVAIILVVAAMVAYYHFAGIVASCAVLLNVFIMWGVLQNLGAALTLPGIAGIVLTIGMAVDANVLVFERIREEFAQSGRIGSAIQAGYRKAFSAIIDSNLTTIIAALILIQFDSGPIKGFAVTLIIGIISSMFTALFMTRYFFAGWVRHPENKELSMARFLKETHFDFLAQSKKAFIISILLMVIGLGFFVKEKKTLFGMDFTGGYSLTVDLVEKANQPNYRLEAMNAFLDHGATRTDLEVRELSHPYQLRIQFGTSMDEQGHPFYQMPDLNPAEGKYAFEYQKNPRLNWVVESLKSNQLDVQSLQLSTLQNHWTTMSGQFSDAMRNNALFGLGAALLCILLYITVRFEFKFAIGAVAGLVHDVAITLGILAFLRAIGLSVQIDLQVIGAIMTIIGYSLNDTIIVFDRIREDAKILRRMKFRDVVNHALNVTLSRTIMTSGTTLIVLLTLVLLGGHSIFAFSLVMTIGVLVGTLSSLFIASPVMLYFHDREVENHEVTVQ